MKRIARRCLPAALCTVAAAPAGAEPPAVLPMVYAACTASPGDPTRVAVRDTPKGPVVVYERADLPRQETRDANLAFKSRRLFFKLKVGDALIEFQGHARDADLDGLLSDERGARRITMPAAKPDGSAACDRHA